MPKKPTLQSLGIRHFDENIHDQPREWLIERFAKGAREYPINVSLLMRNIIWQLRERVVSGKRELLKELIRTFWYMYIKPTLSRVGALTHETDQYMQLVDTLVSMVKDWRLMDYKDIGFRDDNRFNRKAGTNANIILYSEKLGHQDFLAEVAKDYSVSILALGGQPSVMNVEYFVDELKEKNINLQRSFFLFSIVDFDPSGWIVRNSFIDDLNRYGIKNIKNTDLINPDMLTPEEIKLSRFTVPNSESMQKKNTGWIRETKTKQYQNYEHIAPAKDRSNKRIIYGLEAESISSKRLREKLDELLSDLIGKDEDMLQLLALEKLAATLKELLLVELL